MQQTKKWAGILLIFLTITAFLTGGAAVYDGWNYISIRTIQPGWRMAVPLFTSAKSAPSEWGCGNVETAYGYFAIPASWNYVEMRVYTSGSNASLECLILVGDGVSDYINAASIQCVTSDKSQIRSADDGLYFSKMTATDLILNGTTASSDKTTIATYRFDRRWIRRLVLIPTALTTGCSAGVEIIGY